MPDHVPLLYDLLTPPRILFGWGRRAEIGKLARPLGTRALLVTGSRTLERNGAVTEIVTALEAEGIEAQPLASIKREPEVADVDGAVAALRDAGLREGDFLLAVGGGSAIDLAKAVAALVAETQSDTVVDYLEGVGRGLKLAATPLPLLALPTTAGTGSEATKNAVISSYDPPFKKSLRDERMVPRAVLVDPELAVSVPATTTAHTGMDALTQLIESYLSARARPVPQTLALEGLARSRGALVEAVRNPHSRPAREAMAHAALLSGIALANSGLGLAHGVAAALGVHCRVPHGLACAVMLPAALRVNRPVREAELARVAEAMTSRRWTSTAEAADAAVEHVEQLCREVGIPQRLSEIGVQREQLPALVQSSRGNSMSGNPRQLDDAELTELLEGLL